MPGLARVRGEGKRLPIAPTLEKRIREALAAPGRPGDAKRSPFHVHPGVSLVDVCPRRAPNGGSNMAFRKTRDTAEHDQPAETEVEAELQHSPQTQKHFGEIAYLRVEDTAHH